MQFCSRKPESNLAHTHFNWTDFQRVDPAGGRTIRHFSNATLNHSRADHGGAFWPWALIAALGACYGRSMPSAVPNHEIARAIDDPPGILSRSSLRTTFSSPTFSSKTDSMTMLSRHRAQ